MVLSLSIGVTRRVDPKWSWCHWTFSLSLSLSLSLSRQCHGWSKVILSGHGWSKAVCCCSFEDTPLSSLKSDKSDWFPSFTLPDAVPPCAVYPPKPSWAGSAGTGGFFTMESLAEPLVPLPLHGVTLCPRFHLQCGLAVLHYILQKNIWEDSEVASWFCTSVSFPFHAVSPSPGLVKLLALSNFQARSGHLVITVSPDISASLLPNSWYFVIGASYPMIECALLSQVSRTQWLLCADLPPLLVHCRWLDSGKVFSSLTHSTSEE